MSEGETKVPARYKPLAKKVGGSSPLGPTSEVKDFAKVNGENYNLMGV